MGEHQTRGVGDEDDLVETIEERDRTAEDRDQRAEAGDRARASHDRRGGASDRTRAADDRKAALADRAASARERAAASMDELTGAYRRDAGIVELEREVARAKRTRQPLALAFVDVDHLKATNDSLGHAAGDRLLRETADSIRAHLRPYDLIIRFGGDEFLCALLDATVAEASMRFSLVNADLARTHQSSLTVGLTELQADDALGDLIARADQAMYSARRQPRPADG